MLYTLKNLLSADTQTKIFILMIAIYMGALVWTTVQSFARLEYSRTGDSPTSINTIYQIK